MLLLYTVTTDLSILSEKCYSLYVVSLTSHHEKPASVTEQSV